jgi:hypothetical protein
MEHSGVNRRLLRLYGYAILNFNIHLHQTT